MDKISRGSHVGEIHSAGLRVSTDVNPHTRNHRGSHISTRNSFKLLNTENRAHAGKRFSSGQQQLAGSGNWFAHEVPNGTGAHAFSRLSSTSKDHYSLIHHHDRHGKTRTAGCKLHAADGSRRSNAEVAGATAGEVDAAPSSPGAGVKHAAHAVKHNNARKSNRDKVDEARFERFSPRFWRNCAGNSPAPPPVPVSYEKRFLPPGRVGEGVRMNRTSALGTTRKSSGGAAAGASVTLFGGADGHPAATRGSDTEQFMSPRAANRFARRSMEEKAGAAGQVHARNSGTVTNRDKILPQKNVGTATAGKDEAPASAGPETATGNPTTNGSRTREVSPTYRGSCNWMAYSSPVSKTRDIRLSPPRAGARAVPAGGMHFKTNEGLKIVSSPAKKDKVDPQFVGIESEAGGKKCLFEGSEVPKLKEVAEMHQHNLREKAEEKLPRKSNAMAQIARLEKRDNAHQAAVRGRFERQAAHMMTTSSEATSAALGSYHASPKASDLFIYDQTTLASTAGRRRASQCMNFTANTNAPDVKPAGGLSQATSVANKHVDARYFLAALPENKKKGGSSTSAGAVGAPQSGGSASGNVRATGGSFGTGHAVGPTPGGTFTVGGGPAAFPVSLGSSGTCEKNPGVFNPSRIVLMTSPRGGGFR